MPAFQSGTGIFAGLVRRPSTNKQLQAQVQDLQMRVAKSDADIATANNAKQQAETRANNEAAGKVASDQARIAAEGQARDAQAAAAALAGQNTQLAQERDQAAAQASASAQEVEARGQTIATLQASNSAMAGQLEAMGHSGDEKAAIIAGMQNQHQTDLGRISALEGDKATLQDQNQALSTQVAEGIAQRNTLQSTIEARNTTIGQQADQIAARDATIADQATTIAQRNQTIAIRDATIADQATAIAQKDQTIATRTAERDAALALAAARWIKVDLANIDVTDKAITLALLAGVRTWTNVPIPGAKVGDTLALRIANAAPGYGLRQVTMTADGRATIELQCPIVALGTGGNLITLAGKAFRAP